MQNYQLRFACEDLASEQSISFYAHSTAGALEIAQERAVGDWAELHSDGRLVSRMRLVDETGVWLIQRRDPLAG